MLENCFSKICYNQNMNNSFAKEAAGPSNPKWDNLVKRAFEALKKETEIRSDFEIDINRILNCNAFRRLKHKTQVFFSPQNDHICTRIEHVQHVNSVSYTIAKYLGLNTELATAIALGHDLGHAPFGHWGETILKEISQKELGKDFWHEKNSLYFADKIETLPDSKGNERNLNLTYGVRDGIISHCGEAEENGIRPREDFIALESISAPNQHAPYTWEACVVKIADKISYLGRDIEDALTLEMLLPEQVNELKNILEIELKDINNTNIIGNLTRDICQNSSLEKGICFSESHFRAMRKIREFNFKNIYFHKRLVNYMEYARLAMESIFKVLSDTYVGEKSLERVKSFQRQYPLLMQTFYGWMEKYSDAFDKNDPQNKYKMPALYKIADKKDYSRAIIDFISGMTDSFAVRIFEELISFR